MRSAVQAGHFRYVLTAGGTEPWESGDSHCLAADPRAKPIIHIDQVVMFRVRQAPGFGSGAQEVRNGTPPRRSSGSRQDIADRTPGARPDVGGRQRNSRS